MPLPVFTSPAQRYQSSIRSLTQRLIRTYAIKFKHYAGIRFLEAFDVRDWFDRLVYFVCLALLAKLTMLNES